MSRRRFLGWEPRRVTTFSYDDEGRLAGSVTVADAEWDDDDRAWAFALKEFEDGLCPGGCGQPAVESMATGADDDYDVQVIACHACATRARRMEDRNNPGEFSRVLRTARTPRGASSPGPSR